MAGVSFKLFGEPVLALIALSVATMCWSIRATPRLPSSFPFIPDETSSPAPFAQLSGKPD
jgi:hypothetical protein